MATVEMTKENLGQVVSANVTVSVDFWAAWSEPCRVIGPIFEAGSEQHDDIVFGKIGAEAQLEPASSFGIQSISPLTISREEVVVYSQPGAVPGETLEESIIRAGEFDMAGVHRQVAAHQAEQSAS
jgi:thioredoxin 1